MNILELCPSRIDVTPAGCWQWKTKCGYGHLMIDKTIWATHRLSWRLSKGGLTEAEFVLHKCDNSKCCNPDHLFIGTQRDNVDDCITKGRRSSVLGADNPCSKLDDEKVKFIRESLLPLRKLAAKFGVSYVTAQKAKSRGTWKHVP